MSNIPVIDLVFLILIALMVIRGYVRGFIEEFFAWAVLVLAIWGAVLLHPAGAVFIRSKVMQNVKFIPEILAFIAIFIIIMLLLKMLKHVLKDVIMGAKLGGANKLLGLVFGLIEGLTITVLILFVLTVQPIFDVSNIIEESIIAQLLLPLVKIPFDRGKDVINTALLTLPGIFRV
jgi:membrane protein required for colicin V production